MTLIDLVISPRDRDLGGFHVRRVLPYMKRRLVGPFVFFDHLGPAQFEAGTGMDVRPHPHIGLATVTYLFDGEILHRDSLGYVQPIPLGDEEREPSFHHHPADTLPIQYYDGVTLKLIAGSAYGISAPVQVFTPMFYVDALMSHGARLVLPDYHERAVYVVSGLIKLVCQTFQRCSMAVLKVVSGRA